MVSERAAPPSSLNLANALTGLRLAAVPVFLVALFAGDGHDPFWRWAAFGVFVAACVTDQLDGYLARRFDMVTELGKFADPVADKALIGSALVGLSLLAELSWWATGVIILREAGVTALRVWALSDGVVAASIGGKIKTMLQAVAIGLLIAPLPQTWRPFLMALVVAAVVVTVGTGLDYAWRIGRGKLSKPGRCAAQGRRAEEETSR
ncbi:CDP-diacylglycerol--glycerol-3-phosphate 3-phosphatidyltransferase [Segniliparus rugosus]|uniref:CDP-diacylglycerol--glycerol-3-phosphate 3-phosphatidyltransferase n=1 Tax=Segniliparus rugosus TaxID=286804 RepID=UPI001FCA8E9E|nr:CDP-diacylglycerol--glycerol-3-phosphate 3-phosphatidyltransferase [Segniliparus rugosus]